MIRRLNTPAREPSKTVSKRSTRTILTPVKGFCLLHKNPIHNSIIRLHGYHYRPIRSLQHFFGQLVPALSVCPNYRVKYCCITRLWCWETPWIPISILFSNNSGIISTINSLFGVRVIILIIPALWNVYMGREHCPEYP